MTVSPSANSSKDSLQPTPLAASSSVTWALWTSWPSVAAGRQSVVPSAMATALSRQLTAARRQYQLLSAHPALQSPVGYLEQRRKSLELLKNRLVSSQAQGIHRAKNRYIGVTAKLDAMSPLKVLTRGYAMAQTEEGSVLKSVSQVNPGDNIKISISDGTLSAAVTEVKENGR